jgi:hypothetical protein
MNNLTSLQDIARAIRNLSRVVHNLNGNGYTTGLELEVNISDVEYEVDDS